MQDPRAYLVIINGAPGVGKTTLAKRLQKDLDIGLVTKDGFKEFLFDTVGTGDREWSFTLGKEVIHFCYHFVKLSLQNDRPVIFESAFWTEHAVKDMRLLLEEVHVPALEVYCTVDEETRQRRFNQRLVNGERHPGHADSPTTSASDVEKYLPLDVSRRVDIDTGELDDSAYTDLLNVIRTFTKGDKK